MKHVERTVSRRDLVAGLTFAAGTCLMGGASPAWAARSVFGDALEAQGAQTDTQTSMPAASDGADTAAVPSVPGITDADRAQYSEGFLTALQALYETLIACSLDLVDISASHISTKDFEAALEYLHTAPWAAHYLTIDYSTRGEETTSFQVSYRIDDAALSTYQADLDAAITSLVAQIDPAASEYDKALYVYDWLQNNVAYDHDVVEPYILDTMSRTPLGALAFGKAVCTGYSSAFALVMERLGIPCEVVDSQEMLHTWNMTCIGGTWYYSDATWDDMDEDIGAQRFYFMVSEQTLARDHWGWTPRHDSPVDLGRPGYVRLSPEICTLADAAIQAVYTYPGCVIDMLDFYIDGETLDNTFYQLDAAGQFWGTYFSWRWRCNEAGFVTRLFVTLQ